MRFYWVWDCAHQGHFKIHWKKGTKNLADYFIKHHTPAHATNLPTHHYTKK